MSEVQVLTGASGKTYEFLVHEIGTTFDNQACIFVFAKEQNGLFEIVHVGEAVNSKAQLTDNLLANPEYDDFRKNRVSHIMIRPAPDKDIRQIILNDIRKGFGLNS